MYWDCRWPGQQAIAIEAFISVAKAIGIFNAGGH